MGNSNSGSNSDSDSDSDSNNGPSTLKKVDAFVTGMGEGYFKSQSKEAQEAQKYTAEAIGTAIGKMIYK